MLKSRPSGETQITVIQCVGSKPTNYKQSGWTGGDVECGISINVCAIRIQFLNEQQQSQIFFKIIFRNGIPNRDSCGSGEWRDHSSCGGSSDSFLHWKEKTK